MKKVILPLCLSVLLVSCADPMQEVAFKECDGAVVAYDVPKYTEPDWLNIDNIQCRQEQWMRVPDAMAKDTLVARLVDAYNANVVLHSVRSDMECYWRWREYTDSAIRAMDIRVIKDAKVRARADAFRLGLAESQYDTAVDVNAWLFNYVDFVAAYYHVSSFVDTAFAAEDAYWKAMDKAQWVDGYASLEKMRGSGDSKYQSLLLAAIGDTAICFDAHCVCALEYAHSSVESPQLEARPYLVDILTAGRYSPLLREVWLTWRALQCSQMGYSQDSDIPNAEYNALRMIACYTTLCHIHEHPTDWLAINNFLVMSYESNIRRRGYYIGNQSIDAQMEVFPEYWRSEGGKD